MARLGDIAKACKSKNAGPFELTLDIMFDDAATFEKVRATGVISAALNVSTDDYQLVLRLYGRNGVMGDAEIVKQSASHEIGILAEAVAKTQEIANAVVGLARVTLLHSDFPGRLCKEGNMAFPFSPSDIERGAIYQFSLRHVVEPDDPLEMFPIEYQDI